MFKNFQQFGWISFGETAKSIPVFRPFVGIHPGPIFMSKESIKQFAGPFFIGRTQRGLLLNRNVDSLWISFVLFIDKTVRWHTIYNSFFTYYLCGYFFLIKANEDMKQKRNVFVNYIQLEDISSDPVSRFTAAIDRGTMEAKNAILITWWNRFSSINHLIRPHWQHSSKYATYETVKS